MESGNLESIPTADLLRELADRDETGCLRIEHRGTQARVYFRGGGVYTAAAPEARARLGDRLVGAGHISEGQLSDTLVLQRSLSSPRRIGELLIERGLIDRETMRSYVREQIADSVAVALSWTDGSWSFTPDEEVTEDIPLDMSVENLLMEGARRLEEWEIIQARIGSVDALVDFVPGGSQAELSLTPDEWSMLTRIDGSSSIREIALAAGYGQFEAARIIYGLLTAGVVTLVAEDEDEDYEVEDDEDDETDAADEADEVDEVEVQDAPSGGLLDDAAYLFEDMDTSTVSAAPPASEPPSDEVPPAPPSDPTPEPAAPPAAEQPPPAAPPAEAPRSPSAPEVNRNELLREFAALDDEDEEEEIDDQPPAPTRRIAPPAPRDREREEDKQERKGLFGRLRRD